MIDAFDYWQTATGLAYTLVDDETPPVIIARSGTDLPAGAGAVGGIIGSPGQDEAQVGDIDVGVPFAGTCTPALLSCRSVFRHEVGHALGFLGEPPNGLMSQHASIGLMLVDTLSERETKMMAALYSLPIGALMLPDGSWTSPDGQAGSVSDIDAVTDILTYNVNVGTRRAAGNPGRVLRWRLPVRVHIRN